jgi:tRNA threonylcarbamoyladenosine biosynthesis protein TsaE
VNIISELPYISSSSEDTFQWGCLLGQRLSLGSIVLLEGNLGAGKTTLIKGIVQGALGLSPEEVTSPTFSYLHIYSGAGKTVYHFDFYRLQNGDDLFQEYCNEADICCVEWSERITHPSKAHTIIISSLGANERLIHFIQHG